VLSKRRIVLDEIIAARAPWAAQVKRDQFFKIIDLKGQQAVDFLCYNANDREERYNAPNTMKAAAALSLTKGHILYSDLANPMLEIVDDTYGGHDTIGGCCSAPSNLMLYGVKDCPGCRENFLAALTAFGMGRRDIVPNVNFFMRVGINNSGRAEIAPANSVAGCYVEMRARMDLLVAISNCPQINNPANAYNPTEIRIIVSELNDEDEQFMPKVGRLS
jgi:urea carboxylase-associated protein 1